MTPMRKIALIGTAVIVPLVTGGAIWLGFAVSEAFQNARFLQGFETITHAKTPLTVAQVEDLMGKPASIEESQSEDQTVSGIVYHYPGHGTDFKIVFINGVVFHSEMPLPKKP
jgi:hypothetical protein